MKVAYIPKSFLLRIVVSNLAVDRNSDVTATPISAPDSRFPRRTLSASSEASPASMGSSAVAFPAVPPDYYQPSQIIYGFIP
ncbi:hypothetical protein [Oceanobacillus massiliensis]|uniref:hypothetical protein n=1 Tax=Oceanobacillus massiliensis TaxID=1465765 RepID=UPI0011C8319D|nr:hypothetical protein [Oceanobacillus massiliensis]